MPAGCLVLGVWAFGWLRTPKFQGCRGTTHKLRSPRMLNCFEPNVWDVIHTNPGAKHEAQRLFNSASNGMEKLPIHITSLVLRIQQLCRLVLFSGLRGPGRRRSLHLPECLQRHPVRWIFKSCHVQDQHLVGLRMISSRFGWTRIVRDEAKVIVSQDVNVKWRGGGRELVGCCHGG